MKWGIYGMTQRTYLMFMLSVLFFNIPVLSSPRRFSHCYTWQLMIFPLNHSNSFKFFSSNQKIIILLQRNVNISTLEEGCYTEKNGACCLIYDNTWYINIVFKGARLSLKKNLISHQLGAIFARASRGRFALKTQRDRAACELAASVDKF